ncbi:MAG: hypothetical protein LUM44_11230 [Pyrinomonadaceae bacterium]|nr:hypothetical protein [Pyrinomonadaceae bacterium]
MKNIFCPGCGVSHSREHSFCLNCGTEIKFDVIPYADNQYVLNVIPPSGEPSMPTIEMTRSVTAHQTAQPYRSGTATKRPLSKDNENSKKNKSWRRIPLVILILLIFGGVTFTINVYQRNDKSLAQSQPHGTVNTPTQKPKPSPVVKEDEDLPPEFEKAHTVRVTDSKGKTGEIGVGILLKGNSWETGSRTYVIGLGDLSKRGKNAFSTEFQNKIRSYPEVIPVGTSDARKTLTGGQTEEIDRSYDRLSTLFSVTKQIRNDEASIKALNLGQWDTTKCPGNVSYLQQRRIIFMWLVRSDDGFNLKEGVQQALKALSPGEPIYQNMLECYTNFDLS